MKITLPDSTLSPAIIYLSRLYFSIKVVKKFVDLKISYASSAFALTEEFRRELTPGSPVIFAARLPMLGLEPSFGTDNSALDL